MKKLADPLPYSLREWNTPILAIVVALMAAICCANAHAQSGAGSIQGTVEDATRAVVPGAAIHVVNQATSVAADTKSNGVGFYQVPGLFTGPYTVTITAPGFKTYTTKIELLVNQNVAISPVLTPGDVTQQVVVTGNLVQLTTTDSGTISSTLENSRINQLPMNGRSILTLLGESTAGLESTQGQPAGAAPNGLLSEAMEYVADGVTLTNRQFGGSQSGVDLMPDPDAIQEVRVETVGLGAQCATPAAGIITTKSGTNALHGTMFETARNSYWGIAKARQNPSNYVVPPLIRNEFGISAGGPIVIPHLYNGKNKSFWFFAYERYSLAQVTNENVSVPMTAWKQGDFSGLVNSSGSFIQLYDPNTTTSNPACPTPGGAPASNPSCRTPFGNGIPNDPGNNQIPMNRLSPAAKILFDISPTPTTAANPLVTTNFAAPAPIENRTPTITFRLDHVFNENNRVYLRYTDDLSTVTQLRNQPSNQPATVAADGFPANASGTSKTIEKMYNSALGYTHVFSPTFFSETIISQQWFTENDFAAGSPFTNFEQQLGLPNNFGELGFPEFVGPVLPFDGTMYQYGMDQIISNIDENLTKTVGKHELKFGGRYRHERFFVRPDQSTDEVTFDGYGSGLLNPATIAGNTYTPATNTGNANADMFLGAANLYSVSRQPPYEHFHDMEFDAYFQDDYHVSKNLTFNLGLRYEAHPAPWEKYGLMMSFDLKNDAVVTAAPLSTLIAEGYTSQATITNDMNDGAKFETAQQAGMPSALIKNTDFTIGPRAGFAYQPFGGGVGTVIRGAYGRFIFPVPIRSALILVNENNPLTATYNQSYTGASQAPDGLPSYILRAPQTTTGPVSAGTPVMGVNTSGVVNSSATSSILPGITETNVDPDIKPYFATQVDLTIEQPLKGNSVLRVSWVYSHGSNLNQEYRYNTHPSSYVWEMQTGTTPPNGGSSTIGTNQYATTATGPYDKVTWATGNDQIQTTGWSNDNALQVNYQRLFHRGIAYQIMYVWSKPFRVGGQHSINNSFYPAVDFVGNSGAVGTMTPAYGAVIEPALPPPAPTGYPSWASSHALDRFENYMVDTLTPKQHIQFDGIVDLPFGRGKHFLGNVNRFWNELVGGFEIAGDGNIVSQDFSINATNWGQTSPLHVYKHGAPITDCRSGVCRKEYLWFNGYLAPTVTTGIPGSVCTSNCISGLPADYVPYQTPIDNTPGTTYYGQNEVNITLTNGKTSAIAYAPGPATSTSAGGGPVGENPFSHTILNGPINWSADASIFKVFPITQTVYLRFNMDAFNVFNVQGYTNPNATDGTETITPGVGVASSYNSARQLQFSLRLTF